MTARRYMIWDMTVFAFVFCVLETASFYALNLFPGEIYALSLVPFLALLMMMRWGWPGVFHAIFGGAVYAVLHGGTAVSLVVYALGSGFVALNLLWFKYSSGNQIRGSKLYTALYCVTGYCAICLGRAVIASLAGSQFFPVLMRFFSVETLGAVFTVILILIARRQNGIFEPQKDYLLRLAKEEEERKHGA